MNTKFLVTAVTCLTVTSNCNLVHATSNVSELNNKTVDTKFNNAKSQITNQKRDKKFYWGFDFSVRAQCDWQNVSFKSGVGEKILSALTTAYGNSVSQEEVTDAVTRILNTFPNLQNTINNLSSEQKNTVDEAVKKVLNPNVSSADGMACIETICNSLGIDKDQFINMMTNKPFSRNMMFVAVSNPGILKDDLTKDEFIPLYNKRISDLFADLFAKGFLTSNSYSKKFKDYTNWDIGVGVFANYFVNNNIYLIGGVSFIYDLAGSKGRKIKYDGQELLESYGVLSNLLSKCASYKLPYAITPKLGIGIQCSKSIAIELLAFDQVTKCEYDCSSVSKIMAIEGMTDIFPEKKQSNWINRFGAELGLRVSKNDCFFTKLSLFYLFPTNVAKKMQPLDLKLQSVGASFSVGVMF